MSQNCLLSNILLLSRRVSFQTVYAGTSTCAFLCIIKKKKSDNFLVKAQLRPVILLLVQSCFKTNIKSRIAEPVFPWYISTSLLFLQSSCICPGKSTHQLKQTNPTPSYFSWPSCVVLIKERIQSHLGRIPPYESMAAA